MSDQPVIASAEVVLPCPDLDRTVAWFRDRLGFRLEMIMPADSPRVAVIYGHGVRLRLDATETGDPGRLRLHTERTPTPPAETAPNGTRVEWFAIGAALEVPAGQPSFVLTRRDDTAPWIDGRAGMRYRDLIPDRQGGRFIASHIQIADGGPVPDYVHYHHVRFQMIYCRRGWVRVVYEDQGESFVMQAGDCVLQPPGIRHRVLESSPGLEVIEIGSPAEHETRVDHDLDLPTPDLRPECLFGGQRFALHRAESATWVPHRLPVFEARAFGFGAATSGLAEARVVRSTAAPPSHPALSHGGELLFLYVLSGSLQLQTATGTESLAADDCCVIPPDLVHCLTDVSEDVELLEVTLPARLPVESNSGRSRAD